MNRYIIIIIKLIILFLALLHTGCPGTIKSSPTDTFSKKECTHDYRRPEMKEHFRFIIEMEAEIHDSPMEPCIPEIYENVKGVALKIRSDKEMLTTLLGINFFDLLAGDYYTETLLREMGLKKEKEAGGINSRFQGRICAEPVYCRISYRRDGNDIYL